MKVKQILSIKEIADDKRLPCDMYELYNTKYMSVSRDKMISIEDMDIVHLIRAFKNDRHRLANQITDDDLIKQNEDLVSANKQLAKQHDIWKEKAMNMVEKSTHEDKLKETISTYNTYLANSMPLESFKKINNQCEELQLENVRLVQQLEHDEYNVGNSEELENTLKGTIKANSELIQLNKQLKESLRQVNLTPTVSTQAYDIAWKNNEVLKEQVKHWKKLAEDNFIQSVDDSETSDTFKNKYEELRKTYAVLLEDYNRDTGRDIWKKRYEQELENAEFWKKAYMDYDPKPKGCNYTFSEIPNDTDGQEFVDTMKKYFNKKSYKMRVRGQHIKPELKGTGATYWGQNKDESSHMRVYIDVK